MLTMKVVLATVVPAALLPTAATTSSGAQRPNLLLVMCDDLDTLLGSEIALPQTRRLLASGGARAMNYFVSSPKCTPSRSAWLSGRHYHNLRPNGAKTGPGLNTSNFFDQDAVFPSMRRAGYTTAIFGKIHNNQGGWLCSPDNHSEPFDHVETECSPCGGYYRTGVDQWVTKATHNSPHVFETLDPADPFSNYSEAQYGNRSARWIRRMHTESPDKPWFVFIGTSGPHLGVVPAPWHRWATHDFRINGTLAHAPRTPNFNQHAPDHHPLLATQPELDENALAHIDLHFRDRLGTLLSIDDMVAGVVATIDQLQLAQHTYIMFTSDHGYHLGQFRIPDEKIEPYETDVRVPFYIRGPGIKPGTEVGELVSNIDIGPTLCELGGIAPPNLMDGRSMVPLLISSDDVDDNTDAAVAQRRSKSNYISGFDTAELAQRLRERPWRTHFMIEFAEAHLAEWGTNGMWNFSEHGAVVDLAIHPPWGPGCATKAQCANNTQGEMRHDYEYINPAYNWRALRVINATDDFQFVQWDELYLFDAAPATGGIQPATNMPGVNIDGDPIVHPCGPNPVDGGNRADPSLCAALCVNTTGCLGWVLHDNANDPEGPAPGWRCCLKKTIRSLDRAESGTISGILSPSKFHPPAAPSHGGISFTEYYNIRQDPWQQTNLWPRLPAGKKQALEAEIKRRFACTGTRDTPSNCE